MRLPCVCTEQLEKWQPAIFLLENVRRKMLTISTNSNSKAPRTTYSNFLCSFFLRSCCTLIFVGKNGRCVDGAFMSTSLTSYAIADTTPKDRHIPDHVWNKNKWPRVRRKRIKMHGKNLRPFFLSIANELPSTISTTYCTLPFSLCLSQLLMCVCVCVLRA